MYTKKKKTQVNRQNIPAGSVSFTTRLNSNRWIPKTKT